MNAGPKKLVQRRSELLNMERGEPYIYQVRFYRGLDGKAERCVDCGFKIHLPINEEIINYKNKLSSKSTECIRTVKKGNGYDLKMNAHKRGLIYTYAARPLKVIDGDTIDAQIDVGFGIRIVERLRFLHINTPEIGKKGGVAAKRFLKEHLRGCRIIVRTREVDSFGRWLSDIFVKRGCRDPHIIAAKGEYLNQTLLDKGFAEIYNK